MSILQNKTGSLSIDPQGTRDNSQVQDHNLEVTYLKFIEKYPEVLLENGIKNGIQRLLFGLLCSGGGGNLSQT